MINIIVELHFRPKASAHRYRSPHIDVLATRWTLASDSGQPYAGEWTKWVEWLESQTRDSLSQTIIIFSFIHKGR